MDESDILLVLGTSGVVLPVNEIAAAHPGISILNNLRPEAAVDPDVFDYVFYKPATEAVHDIDALLRQHIG